MITRTYKYNYVPVKIIFTIAAVSSIVTLFWLLVGLAA